jgi:hypothetical protein
MIPLKTPVSFHWTVPLKDFSEAVASKYRANALNVITRAGHPILFSLFDIRYSDTSAPVFGFFWFCTPARSEFIQLFTRLNTRIYKANDDCRLHIT